MMSGDADGLCLVAIQLAGCDDSTFLTVGAIFSFVAYLILTIWNSYHRVRFAHRLRGPEGKILTLANCAFIVIVIQRIVLFSANSDWFLLSGSLYRLSIFVLNATVQYMSLECLQSFSDVRKESQEHGALLPGLLRALMIKPLRFTLIFIQCVPCILTLIGYDDELYPTRAQKFTWLWYTDIALVVSLSISLSMTVWISMVLKAAMHDFMLNKIKSLTQSGISMAHIRSLLESHRQKLPFKAKDLPEKLCMFLQAIEKLARLAFLIQTLSSVVMSLLPIFIYIVACFQHIIESPSYRIPLVIISDFIAPISFLFSTSITHRVLLISVANGDALGSFLHVPLPNFDASDEARVQGSIIISNRSKETSVPDENNKINVSLQLASLNFDLNNIRADADVGAETTIVMNNNVEDQATMVSNHPDIGDETIIPNNAENS